MADDRLYEALGVRRDATSAEIERGYRRLAERARPDAEATYAYEVLADPERRSSYDRYGLRGAGVGVGVGAGAGASSDALFSHLFGDRFFGMGGFGGGGRQPARGEDTVHRLKVTLEDAYNGKTARLEVARSVVCERCGGVGGKADAMVACAACLGRGEQLAYRSLNAVFRQAVQTTCGACRGSGGAFDERDLCAACDGQRVVDDARTLEVRVERGARDGQRIVFRGEGDRYPNVAPGDVVVVLQLRPHDAFRRDGDDLHATRALTLTEALCGFAFVVEHLDGRELLVKSEPGAVVKPGDVRRVRGEGMPKRGRPFEKGDLFVRFDVTFPDDHYQSAEKIGAIEKCLPPRPPFVMPVGENVEEVDLTEYVESRPSDEDDERAHVGGGLQCAQQM